MKEGKLVKHTQTAVATFRSILTSVLLTNRQRDYIPTRDGF